MIRTKQLSRIELEKRINDSAKILFDLAQSNSRDAFACKDDNDNTGYYYHIGRYDAYMNSRAELLSVLEPNDEREWEERK